MAAMDELASISHLLPLPVLQDVDKRCGDWLAVGGGHDDPYIHQPQSVIHLSVISAADRMGKERRRNVENKKVIHSGRNSQVYQVRQSLLYL